MIVNEDVDGEDFCINLECLLAFITGADHIPPIGFPNAPQITFEPNKDRLPSASTCGPTLYLPLVLRDPDYFRDKKDYALSCVHGFGNP